VSKKPFIDLGNNQPGIIGLLAYNPDMGLLISSMAEALLRGDKSTIPIGDRELLFAYTSGRNNCVFCMRSHMAIASKYLGEENVRGIINGSTEIRRPKKLMSLLRLVDVVCQGGYKVTSVQIGNCMEAGCTDAEIHDAVQIAAFACMCNRYVDGLGTIAPEEGDKFYADSAEHIFKNGYLPQSEIAVTQQAPAEDVVSV
jgi:uncharacterized peroxidase-related enzyme